MVCLGWRWLPGPLRIQCLGPMVCLTEAEKENICGQKGSLCVEEVRFAVEVEFGRSSKAPRCWYKQSFYTERPYYISPSGYRMLQLLVDKNVDSCCINLTWIAYIRIISHVTDLHPVRTKVVVTIGNSINDRCCFHKIPWLVQDRDEMILIQPANTTT